MWKLGSFRPFSQRNRIPTGRRHQGERYFIYILQCYGGAYYVGSTNNPERRLLQHISHQGSDWTRLYPPIGVLEVFPVDNAVTREQLLYVETVTTLKVMATYGWDRVRGGIFNRTSPQKTARMLQDRRNQTRYNYNSRLVFGL